MKKYLFVLVALSVSFFIGDVNAVDLFDRETPDFRKGGRKINENLYTCKYTLPNKETISFCDGTDGYECSQFPSKALVRLCKSGKREFFRVC